MSALFKIIMGWLKAIFAPINYAKSHACPASTKDDDEVLSDFGKLLQEYPLSYFDVSVLPLSKAEMKKLFKRCYLLPQYQVLKSALEFGYIHLGHFQEGVGINSVHSPTFGSDPETILSKEPELEKWLLWGELAQKEMQTLAAEWKQFKTSEAAYFKIYM